MTTLVTEKLSNGESVEQKIRLYKSVYIKCIRVHVLRNGILSDGNLTLDVYDGTTKVASKTITHTKLNSIPGTYWHGMISFVFDNAPFFSMLSSSNKNYKELTLKFTMSGHTDRDNKFLCICYDYEKFLRNKITDFKNPPLYGEFTEDGLTTSYSDSQPVGIAIYKLDQR